MSIVQVRMSFVLNDRTESSNWDPSAVGQSILPAMGDEALTDLPVGQYQVAAVVSAKFDREVGECHEQRELVGRCEIPFGEQTLQLREELQFGFRRWR